MSAPLFHYCIVRRDLPLGTLAAQLIHAAGESARSPDGVVHAVALAADDELDLVALERRLIFEHVEHRAIREPDLPWCGALMAIGVAPTRDLCVRRIFRRFELLR